MAARLSSRYTSLLSCALLLCVLLLLDVRCVQGRAALYIDEPSSLAAEITNEATKHDGYQGFYGEAVGVTGVSRATHHHCDARPHCGVLRQTAPRTLRADH